MSHSISVFLISERATGPRTYVLDNSKCQAIVVPRVAIQDMWDRPEFSKCGLYLLTGANEGGPLAYIGQSKNVKERITDHLKNPEMDFFNTLIIFTAQSDTGLDEADIRYLEAMAYERAVIAKNTQLANTQKPKHPKLAESKKAAVEHYFTHVELLASLIGCDIFDIRAEKPPVKEIPKESPIFRCSKSGHVASCVYDESGVTVLAGSQMFPHSVPSYKNGAERDALIAKLTETIDGKPTLKLNRSFSSFNQALAFCLGRNENAMTHWVTDDGITAKQYLHKED